MKASPLLLFPVSEYQRCLNKILAAMEREGFDAVILTSDENTFYLSGFRSIVWDSKVSTPGAVVVTKDGAVALATSQVGAPTAGATSCVEDIRTYGKDGYPTYVKAITSLLEERGVKNGRIGFELGTGHKMHLNYTMTQELFSELHGAEIADAAAILWEARSVKSPLEVEAIAKACEINVACIRKGFSELREGMTEMELYGNIMGEYLKNGADNTLPLGLRAGADRYSQSNCPPSYRPIMRGEIILVDGGPIYHGYYSDIIREAVIGEPTTRQQDIFDVAREACYVGIEAVRPGEPISSVCRAVDDFFDKSRFAEINMYRNWCGHSIGVGVHEYPMLDASADGLLEPGMVFAIEPYIFEDGSGSLGIEQNFVVTESGYRILSPGYDELIRL